MTNERRRLLNERKTPSSITDADQRKLKRMLSAPFADNQILYRVGSKGRDNTAMMLAYLDARMVHMRLDQAVGPFAWENEVTIQGAAYVSRVTLHLPSGQVITRSDGADGSQVEAIKGGISDSFKRTGVLFGIGSYLYRMPNIFVPMKQNGKYPTDEGIAMLRKAHANLAVQYNAYLDQHFGAIDADTKTMLANPDG